ncbi:MAG: SAM-dependent methyltransferase, partial [Atopobiaceae bacterium]|nr:SAM-dependent methyltransferase [Atopobiaceae bacterium]
GVETISGVPSFCAVAARLGVSLAEWDEAVRIVPLTHLDGRMTAPDLTTDHSGTMVLMKPGEGMGAVRDHALSAGRELLVVENCGLEGERVYRCAADVPDRLGYLSVALLRDAEPRD